MPGNITQFSLFSPESYLTPSRTTTAPRTPTPMQPIHLAQQAMPFPIAPDPDAFSAVYLIPLPESLLEPDATDTPIVTQSQTSQQHLDHLYQQGHCNSATLLPETLSSESTRDQEISDLLKELTKKQLDFMKELCEIPKCPITLSYIHHVVTSSTGICYEKSAIESWVKAGHSTCPATNQPLVSLREDRYVQNKINSIDQMLASRKIQKVIPKKGKKRACKRTVIEQSENQQLNEQDKKRPHLPLPI